ncbi:MAG: thermonuclease family protein [Candidatus Competibacteraceae bacterium]|jgi:endonuclease YncB( thermonuclease family)|nr:thermonuclease family protein [Candidatus Competibacteraceae bacterium]
MRSFLTIVLLTLAIPLAQAETIYQGRTVAVHDGDTLTLLTETGQSIKVRLAEIDAPEQEQPYGNRAKSVLSTLTLNRPTQVDASIKDRYGRVVGRVYVGDMDVNAELIRLGMAWFYRQYGQDNSFYQLEMAARTARWGLWADPRPVPPWVFRHNAAPITREKTVYKCQQADGQELFQQAPCLEGGEEIRLEIGSSRRRPRPVVRSSGYQYLCNRRPTCSTMKDCREAKFFYAVCQFKYLDRDGDGTPCHSLCR